MDLRKIVSTFILFLLFSQGAWSGTVICSGKVTSLAYHANNRFMIQLDSMNVPVFFCNPDSEWVIGGTSYKTGTESCKMLYSTFLAAKMAGKTISSMYFDGDQVPGTCDGWNNWNSANIRYYSVAD